MRLVWSCKSEIGIRDARAAFAEEGEEKLVVAAPVSVCVSVRRVVLIMSSALWVVKPVVSLVDG